MPRGDNPNSRANLIKNSDLSPKERQEKARKAGQKSGEVKRALKTFIEIDQETTTDAERAKMLGMLKKRAEQGNLRAFELYANYMGLKPAEKISVSAIDDEAINGLKDAIASRRSDHGTAD